jgi:hypothetical protein
MEVLQRGGHGVRLSVAASSESLKPTLLPIWSGLRSAANRGVGQLLVVNAAEANGGVLGGTGSLVYD